MNNLFNQSDTAGILVRIEKLSPNAQRQWGKMNVNQMLAHCNASLETAMGLSFSKRLGFVGRLFGKLLKPAFFGEKPFPKNSATDQSYIIKDNPDFEKEKAKVIEQITIFSDGGPAKCATTPHAFFGELTPEQWAIMQWKHFDHHLRQFGA
ncbi:DUF1569 domain-containing protein [Pedobacter metabolipauper]|uniref:Uncharacterized protein DUF1569 n=1 Tax=Pedobacter metabolipauper TaxID=425513 RepID=A0A4R6SWC2_9SPHI|nr:DUF1569 domain-containing protein [Pedobacter metabolipauper]TDQ10120.1 uncharacterized protein DUF1569 [Pedobacter metabolipauper]